MKTEIYTFEPFDRIFEVNHFQINYIGTFVRLPVPEIKLSLRRHPWENFYLDCKNEKEVSKRTIWEANITFNILGTLLVYKNKEIFSSAETDKILPALKSKYKYNMFWYPRWAPKGVNGFYYGLSYYKYYRLLMLIPDSIMNKDYITLL